MFINNYINDYKMISFIRSQCTLDIITSDFRFQHNVQKCGLIWFKLCEWYVVCGIRITSMMMLLRNFRHWHWCMTNDLATLEPTYQKYLIDTFSVNILFIFQIFQLCIQSMKPLTTHNNNNNNNNLLYQSNV